MGASTTFHAVRDIIKNHPAPAGQEGAEAVAAYQAPPPLVIETPDSADAE